MSPPDVLLLTLKLATIRLYFELYTVDHSFTRSVVESLEPTEPLASVAKLVPPVVVTRPTNAKDAAKLQENVIAHVTTTMHPDQLDERTLGLGLAFIDMTVAAWTAYLLDLAITQDPRDGHGYLAKNKLTERFQQRLADTRKVLASSRESFGLAIDRFVLVLGDDPASQAIRSAASTLKEWVFEMPSFIHGVELRHDKLWRDSMQEAMRRVLVALSLPVEPPKSAQPEVASTEETELLAKIVDHPDDDALRLRWADLAEARGEPRAAFVRAQMQRRAQRRALRTIRLEELEVAEFLLRNHPEWADDLRSLGAEDVTFHGGFPEAITITAEAFEKNAETLLRMAPIRRLRLKAVGKRLDKLLASGWLDRIVWLDLSGEGFSDRDAAVLGNAQSLTALRALSLENNRLTDSGVRRLWGSSRLRSLVYCGLDGNRSAPLAKRELTHQEMSQYEWVLTDEALALQAELGPRRWALPSDGDWPPPLEVLATEPRAPDELPRAPGSAWSATSEEDRAAMLAHARAIAQKECDEADSHGQSCVARQPTVDVVVAVTTAAGLVVTMCASYRIHDYAQSGSDSAAQYLSVTETTFGAGASIVLERVIEKRVIPMSEYEETFHDDEMCAKAFVEDVISRGLVHPAKSLR